MNMLRCTNSHAVLLVLDDNVELRQSTLKNINDIIVKDKFYYCLFGPIIYTLSLIHILLSANAVPNGRKRKRAHIPEDY